MTASKQIQSGFLNRYTSLPVLIDILSTKKLTLLSPDFWEDRNDAFFMKRFREEQKLKTLLALCFSTRGETFHHWKVFSDGLGGVCIEFDKERLLAQLPPRGFWEGYLTYKKIITVMRDRPDVEEWPFIKRIPYADEGEFRIIYGSKTQRVETMPFEIDISCINRVTLSPWLPKTIVPSVVTAIRSIEGCSRLKVSRSSLIDTERWKSAISKSDTTA